MAEIDGKAFLLNKTRKTLRKLIYFFVREAGAEYLLIIFLMDLSFKYWLYVYSDFCRRDLGNFFSIA